MREATNPSIVSEMFVNPSMSTSDINKIISECPDNTTVYFEDGEYHMKEIFSVSGKNKLTLKLGSAVFRPYFNPENGDRVPTDSIDVFHFEDCEDLEVLGGVIKSETPPTVYGIITEATTEYLEIRLFPKTPLTGKEIFVHGRPVDELDRPCGGFIKDNAPTSKRYELVKNDRLVFANQFVCTNPPLCNMEVEYVGENLCRIRNFTNHLLNLSLGKFKPGTRLTLGYVYYGNAAFVFTNCKNVLMDGTRFSAFGGMGVVVLPDCFNFTFKNIVMKSDENDFCTEPLQADGIHIAGCGGKVVFDSCYFEYVKDDVLNIRSQLLTATVCNNGRIELIHDKYLGIVMKNWAKNGDELLVYDAKTKLQKGKVTVISFNENSAITDAPSKGININPGDFIANYSHFCEFEAKDCRFKACGGGLKLRTIRKALVHDCVFDGLKKSVNLSASFSATKEAGAVSNAVIENNIFANVGYDFAIFSGVYTDGEKLCHIHNNITVRNNKFINGTALRLLDFSATDNLTIEDNILKNCNCPFLELCDCDGVVCRNNITE